MKYKLGDKVIFKYQDNERVGIINGVYQDPIKDFHYMIQGMSKDIFIRESNITHLIESKVLKPAFRMRIL